MALLPYRCSSLVNFMDSAPHWLSADSMKFYINKKILKDVFIRKLEFRETD